MASRQVTEEPEALEQPGTDAVCVAVHIRPLVPSELAEGCQPCLAVTPGQPQARSQLCATQDVGVFGAAVRCRTQQN